MLVFEFHKFSQRFREHDTANVGEKKKGKSSNAYHVTLCTIEISRRSVIRKRTNVEGWMIGAFCRSNEVCQENDGRSPIKLTRVTGGAFAKWLCGASYITFIIPHLHFHISYLHFLFCYKSESLWLIRPSTRTGGATVKGRKRLIRPLFSVYTTLTHSVSLSLWVLLPF